MCPFPASTPPFSLSQWSVDIIRSSSSMFSSQNLKLQEPRHVQLLNHRLDAKIVHHPHFSSFTSRPIRCRTYCSNSISAPAFSPDSTTRLSFADTSRLGKLKRKKKIKSKACFVVDGVLAFLEVFQYLPSVYWLPTAAPWIATSNQSFCFCLRQLSTPTLLLLFGFNRK